MTPEFVLDHTIQAAMSLLPAKMDSPETRAMLLAIGLQESKFAARVQGGGGPARGYWQFELMGGVTGVLTHYASRGTVQRVCEALGYRPVPSTIYPALADNDVLACCFARLLLWTLPGPLASRAKSEDGWSQYFHAWRPGKPHPETWIGHWTRAWSLVALE